MTPRTLGRLAAGMLLLLPSIRAAEAQRPQSRPQTSAVEQLTQSGTVAAAATGSTRELLCRGKPGIDLRIHREQVPERPGYVTMVLRYERPREQRSVGQAGLATVDYGRSVQFTPGSCTWNMGGFDGVPPEPGLVYFDLLRDAQPHLRSGQRDTTVNAAVAYPDLVSLPRYLTDSTRFWLFYVNDATNESISHRSSELVTAGSTPAPAPPPSEGGSLRGGTPASASSVRSGASLPAGPGTASTSRTLLPDVRIWGVATAPGPLGVRLVFNTDRQSDLFQTNRVRVEFSRRRPPWDEATRRWAYPPGWDNPWAAKISFPAHGGYMAEPMARLELGQRYYYLITVESHDMARPPRQDVGSFITSSNPFAKAPPAPGPDPASVDIVGEPLRGDALDVTGALRDQVPGAATAAGTTIQRPDSAAPPTSRTRLPADVRIWGIETKPGTNGVTLWFETDRAWVPGRSRGIRVQFSTQQPRWEGGLLVSRGVASEWREVTSGRFEAEPHWTLEARKRHYYLITVESNDETRRPRQVTGSFLPMFEQ